MSWFTKLIVTQSSSARHFKIKQEESDTKKHCGSVILITTMFVIFCQIFRFLLQNLSQWWIDMTVLIKFNVNIQKHTKMPKMVGKCPWIRQINRTNSLDAIVPLWKKNRKWNLSWPTKRYGLIFRLEIIPTISYCCIQSQLVINESWRVLKDQFVNHMQKTGPKSDIFHRFWSVFLMKFDENYTTNLCALC